MSENIKIYKKTEEGYPKTLLQLPDAPSRLYVLGELPDPMRPAIAIVGARNCSSYGKNMAYEYARILTQRGIQVISGLARGVDAAAHAGAMAAGGKTYGVRLFLRVWTHRLSRSIIRIPSPVTPSANRCPFLERESVMWQCHRAVMRRKPL